MEGSSGKGAAKSQGEDREQGRQWQAFHSLVYSFSHSFFPWPGALGNCAHTFQAQCLFLILTYSNKSRSQGKTTLGGAGLDTTFPIHRGRGLVGI